MEHVQVLLETIAVRLEIVVHPLHLLDSLGRGVQLGDVAIPKKRRLPGHIAPGRVATLTTQVVQVAAEILAAQTRGRLEVRVQTAEDVARHLDFTLGMLGSFLLARKEPSEVLLNREGQLLLVRLEAIRKHGSNAGHSCGGTGRAKGTGDTHQMKLRCRSFECGCFLGLGHSAQSQTSLSESAMISKGARRSAESFSWCPKWHKNAPHSATRHLNNHSATQRAHSPENEEEEDAVQTR